MLNFEKCFNAGKILFPSRLRCLSAFMPTNDLKQMKNPRHVFNPVYLGPLYLVFWPILLSLSDRLTLFDLGPMILTLYSVRMFETHKSYIDFCLLTLTRLYFYALSEVKPVCPSFGWSVGRCVGWSVGWLVRHDFIKVRKFSHPCSHRITWLFAPLI